MSHIEGSHDADLHDENGEHRSTPPTADGHQLELYGRRIRAHLAAHRVGLAPMTDDARVTKSGRVLTDEDFEELASEAEAGYDVAKIKSMPVRRKRPIEWEVKLMVVVEADSVSEAVEQGREDLARWARRGQVNVTNMGTGEAFAVDGDGSVSRYPDA